MTEAETVAKLDRALSDLSKQAHDAGMEIALLRAENKKLRAVLAAANDLLRSTASVADRDGRGTNWEGFKKEVHDALLVQHRLMYPEMYPDEGGSS